MAVRVATNSVWEREGIGALNLRLGELHTAEISYHLVPRTPIRTNNHHDKKVKTLEIRSDKIFQSSFISKRYIHKYKSTHLAQHHTR